MFIHSACFAFLTPSTKTQKYVNVSYFLGPTHALWPPTVPGCRLAGFPADVPRTVGKFLRVELLHHYYLGHKGPGQLRQHGLFVGARRSSGVGQTDAALEVIIIYYIYT